MSDTPLFDFVEILSVSALTGRIRELLESDFQGVRVVGEACDVKHHRNGQVYFTLKDAGAQIACVIWQRSLRRIPFELRNGLEIVVQGSISVYPPHGKYQLVVESLSPKGMGAQDLALRQLKEKLKALGYFDPARKRPLPRFPCRIGLVTSPTGAAVRDILEVLCRRWPVAEILLYPVRVQGDRAPREIAYALNFFSAFPGTDVVILGRGGGNSEDLAAFNQEIVARAVFESKVPIVSAVGHEIDVSLADLVADRRALTPTEAAEIVSPDCEELSKGLTSVWARLAELMLKRVEFGRQKVDDFASRRGFARPLDGIHDAMQRLDDDADRLQRGLNQQILLARKALDGQAARLESLSPLNVLARGYSLTRKESDQAIVRSADDVREGDVLLTTVQRGMIRSRVEEDRKS